MTTSAPQQRVRVAMSGCGAVTELYYAPTLGMLARRGRIDVVALSDPDRSRLTALGTMFPRAAHCSDLESVFVTKPQLLIIASPPRFHVEQVLAALRARMDVLCEKPLAGSCADARRLAEAEAASGRLLAVGMVRRHMPAARMIRTVLTRELLGAITGFEVFEGGPFRWPVHGGEYFDARTSGGGVLNDIGTHLLDLLTWWLGTPTNVAAADDAMGGIEANSCLMLEVGGVPGVVRLSRDWARPNHVTIRGVKGLLRWHLDDVDRVTVTLEGDDPFELRAPSGAPATFLDCFRAQLDAVLDAREGKPAELVRAAELLPSIEVIETAYRERSLMEMPWLSANERAAASRARSRGVSS